MKNELQVTGAVTEGFQLLILNCLRFRSFLLVLRSKSGVGVLILKREENSLESPKPQADSLSANGASAVLLSDVLLRRFRFVNNNNARTRTRFERRIRKCSAIFFFLFVSRRTWTLVLFTKQLKLQQINL